MILAPRMLYARFLSPTSDLLMLQQISNTYGNSMGWLNSANTGKGAASAYQQVSVPNTNNMIPGYGTASMAGQLQIAAQGATVDISDSVMTNTCSLSVRSVPTRPPGRRTLRIWRPRPKPRTRPSRPSWLNCSASIRPCSCNYAHCKTQTRSTPTLLCSNSRPKAAAGRDEIDVS